MSIKRILVIFVSTLFIVSINSPAFTQVPNLINYQGRLIDGSGNALNGTQLFQFNLYNVETGGTSLWNEEQFVEVVQGLFVVKLGSETAFTGAEFENSLLYLEVQIFGSGSGWETLTPRQEITSTFYAMKAGNADTLEGMEATAFSPMDHDHDDRYNTKAEIITFLGNKSDAGHTHSGVEITSGTVADTHIASTIARDSELTAGLAGKANESHSHSGGDISIGTVADIHIASTIARDSELTAGLAGKANIVHTHNDHYFTETEVNALVNALSDRITALETLLTHFSRNDNEITINGANLHITNGTGSTLGTHNGLGNLIVGYNELRGIGNDRSGSHNIVAGGQNNYSSHGGIVVGYHNTISASYSSVSGGYNNTASGNYSSVCGGTYSHAVGDYSTTSGGYQSVANGEYSSVSGGHSGVANGEYASVSGGYQSVAGGYSSSVSGGQQNVANGYYSSVSGGYERSVSEMWNWRGGGYFQSN